MSPLIDNSNCIDCDSKLLLQWELCQSCSKVSCCFYPYLMLQMFILQYMCKNCGKKAVAYIPRNEKFGKICKSCDVKYMEENEGMFIHLD